MMHVLALSDLHGYLPEIPECDLLLLGGDYCPTRNLDQQRRFVEGEFQQWLKAQKARYVVGIAGNHDLIFEKDIELAKGLPWIYLQDEEVDLEGVRIFGTPWTLPFYNWAFMRSEWRLRDIYEKIPEKLDILLTHGPAYRHLDKTLDNIYAGGFELWSRIQKVKPDSVVCGHIHEARGVMDEEELGVRFYNVAHVNAKMEPKFEPMTIQLRA